MEFSLSKPLSSAIEMVKPLEPLAPAGGSNGANGEFQNILGGIIGQVNSTQGTADRQLASFLNGEQIDIHQVATSIQKAEMTFELAIEVRNKVMQAYQEVMRMQI
jgi:flagellar hook-basal body complex protein FliE